jgi:RsiW-degrading membrane proteinase PrsW (M82 family)
VAFAAGIALFASGQPSGSLAMVVPLVLLGGLLPAFTILALTQQRLWQQTSWRRLCLALITGGTLGVVVGLVIELGMVAQLVRLFHLINLSTTAITTDQLNNPTYFIALFLLLAVGAPLAEETTKQIGGFFLLPRIKSRSEAFLIGMAAGIGFNIVETSQYLGVAQADWIAIAIQRIGAGLIHGMGAAMAGLGWYYLFRGKAFSHRWKIGLGCLAYAYLQHALLNGGELIVGSQLPMLHVDVLALHLDAGAFFAVILYVLIVVILWRVTGWLRRAEPVSASASASPPQGAALAVAGANGTAPSGSDQQRAEAPNAAARVGLASETYRVSQPLGQHAASPPGPWPAASERTMFPGNLEPRQPPSERMRADEQGGMQ